MAGSDFDLGEAMLEAIDQIGEVNLPGTLNRGGTCSPSLRVATPLIMEL